VVYSAGFYTFFTEKMMNFKYLALGAFIMGQNVLVIAQNCLDRAGESDRVDRLFLERWSPRAMSGQSLENSQLMALFEAARWAPSSYNEQPWRFLYAHRGTAQWNMFFDLLVPFNQTWCANAGVLVVIVSDTRSSQGGTNELASFDTGASWQNLALQGSLLGLVVHGMGGFDYQRAREMLNIPDYCNIEAMCAIGLPGSLEMLPEYMQKMEKPSGRKSLKEIVCEGMYSF
jgi:nitroreductase